MHNHPIQFEMYGFGKWRLMRAENILTPFSPPIPVASARVRHAIQRSCVLSLTATHNPEIEYEDLPPRLGGVLSAAHAIFPLMFISNESWAFAREKLELAG